jgi:hypothetical protein
MVPGVSSVCVALFRGLKGPPLQLLLGILEMSAIGRPGTIAAWMDDGMFGIDEMWMGWRAS